MKKLSKVTVLPDLTQPISPELLGQVIKTKRLEAQMTQEIAASLCGISKKTLIKIEKGEDVYFSTLYQVIQAFGVDIKITPWGSSSTQTGNKNEDCNDWF